MVNIFACDTDPVISADYLDDKRLGKLAMEATQLAQFAFDLGTDDGRLLPQKRVFTRASKNYREHGVARWTRATLPNLCWLVVHADALLTNHTRAYGTIHATSRVVASIRDALGELGVDVVSEAAGHTEHHNAAANDGLGLNFKHLPPTRAYRTYLAARFHTDKRAVTFKNRLTPQEVQGMLFL